MTSTFTTNKVFEEPGYNDYIDSWNVPMNANFTVADVALGGSALINATGTSGIITLTSAQYRPLSILVSGSPSAAVYYTVPAGVGGQWTVTNNTAGTYPVYMGSAAGGAAIQIRAGYTVIVSCDGSSSGMRFSNNIPAVAAGSNTQVQLNANGDLGASANLTFNGSTLAVTGNQTVSGNLTVSGVINGSGIVPAGAMTMYGGVAAPTGWLLCQGQEVSRSTYSTLFAVVGTTFGAGNGTTTFNVPNLQNVFPIGAGTAALGTTGGAASVTSSSAGAHNHTGNTGATALDVSQIPSHQHPGLTDVAGSHNHSIPNNYITASGGPFRFASGGLYATTTGTVTDVAGDHQHYFTTDPTGGSGSHWHTISIDGTHTHTVATVPPYVALNFIIKT